MAGVVVRHLSVVVLLLQQLLFRRCITYAVVQLMTSPVLAAVVVRHMSVVVLLLQQLLLFIGDAQHTLLFSS